MSVKFNLVSLALVLFWQDLSRWWFLHQWLSFPALCNLQLGKNIFSFFHNMLLSTTNKLKTVLWCDLVLLKYLLFIQRWSGWRYTEMLTVLISAWLCDLWFLIFGYWFFWFTKLILLFIKKGLIFKRSPSNWQDWLFHTFSFSNV